MLKNDINTIKVANKKEHIEFLRTLSKEKYKDVMMEWLEDFEEIKNFSEAKDKIMAKVESRLLDKMEK